MPRARLSSTIALALACAVTVACGELRSADGTSADGGPTEIPGERDGGSSGEDPVPGATPDGGTTSRDAAASGDAGPSAACRPLVLDCLDATAANVFEVPTEGTLQQAFAAAKANDVVQIKGALKVGAGWKIPSYVTFRGCAGAMITGEIWFQGSGGIVEGFTVTNTGGIVANATGSYVIRQNRFVGPAEGNTAGVSAESIDGLVSAQVTAVVEANVFEVRPRGIVAATSYDTGTRSVTITARNNVFRAVESPIIVSEGGLVGVIDAKLEHNTFYDFGDAIRLYDVSRVTKTSGNLFVKGTSAIKGSPYEVAYSFAWNVTTPAGTPPNAGTFATGDPLFVDAANGDLRPSAGSPVVDAVPNGTPIPADDVQGCPRPAGPSGAPPKADVGAYENQ